MSEGRVKLSAVWDGAKADKGLDKTEKNVKDIGKASKKAAKEAEKAAKAAAKEAEKAAKKAKLLRQAIIAGGAAFATKAIFQWGAAAVKQFAAVEQSTIALNAQLARQGTSWQELEEEVDKASGNMLSDMDKLRQIGMGITLGLRPDELVDMMKIARGAARAMGQDVSQMFQSIVTGTARQSKLWLDNLGILINIEQAQKTYAKSIDATVESLTEEQKRQAFTNAVLERGNDILEKLGTLVPTMADELQKMNAQWEDSKTQVGEFLVVGLDLPTIVGFWTTQLGGVTDALFRMSDAMGITAKSMLPLEDQIKEQKNLIRDQAQAIAEIEALSRAGRSPLLPGTVGLVIQSFYTKDQQEDLERLQGDLLASQGLLHGLEKQAKALEKIRQDAGGDEDVPARPVGTDTPPEEISGGAMVDLDAMNENTDFILNSRREFQESIEADRIQFLDDSLTYFDDLMGVHDDYADRLAQNMGRIDALRQEDLISEKEAWLAKTQAILIAADEQIAAWGGLATAASTFLGAKNKEIAKIESAMEWAFGFVDQAKALTAIAGGDVAGFVAYQTAALAHFNAAKQMQKAGKSGGGGGGGRGAAGGGGGGMAERTRAEEQEPDRRATVVIEGVSRDPNERVNLSGEDFHNIADTLVNMQNRGEVQIVFSGD